MTIDKKNETDSVSNDAEDSPVVSADTSDDFSMTTKSKKKDKKPEKTVIETSAPVKEKFPGDEGYS